MSGRLLSHDRLTGMTQVFHHDADTGRNTIEHIQDVEPYVEHTAIRARGVVKKEPMWYVGTTPESLHIQWAKECGFRPWSQGWREYAVKQMNRREYRKFNPNALRMREK